MLAFRVGMGYAGQFPQLLVHRANLHPELEINYVDRRRLGGISRHDDDHIVKLSSLV
ncbi:hypothetical protein [Streptomyces formicae]|uniref:Uncharacterized protein n=1 Tax=Streptomyces formicae TaxID=1616117 RepID=A0ABY3WVH5_9ACTN|nr:hypothetical protein [Streptomyces formicae]UNM15536.1 hypothetical protein J4032_32355 [Streptomyces formicae]